MPLHMISHSHKQQKPVQIRIRRPQPNGNVNGKTSDQFNGISLCARFRHSWRDKIEFPTTESIRVLLCVLSYSEISTKRATQLADGRRQSSVCSFFSFFFYLLRMYVVRTAFTAPMNVSVWRENSRTFEVNSSTPTSNTLRQQRDSIFVSQRNCNNAININNK